MVTLAAGADDVRRVRLVSNRAKGCGDGEEGLAAAARGGRPFSGGLSNTTRRVQNDPERRREKSERASVVTEIEVPDSRFSVTVNVCPPVRPTAVVNKRLNILRNKR